MMRYRMLWRALAGGAIVSVAAVACSSAGPATPEFGGPGNTTSNGTTSGANGASGKPATGNAASGNTMTGAGSSGGTASSGSGSSGSGHAGASNGGGSGAVVATGGSSGGSKGSSTGGGNSQAEAGTGSGSSGGTTMTPPPKGQLCLKPATDDYTGGDKGAGPYQVAMQQNVDLASYLNGAATPTTYTIFYPQPFETNCLHPVVAWGNGTGVTGDQTYGYYNQNAAGYGIVVIASDNSNVGSGQYHKAGIDYLMAQNKDSSSMFYGKLSTRAGTAGHSQGAMGATQATTLIGPNCEAEVSVAGGGAAQKNTAFLCLTGTMDQLESSCTMSFQISGPPSFLADWNGGDHVTTETLAGYISGDMGSIQMKRFLAAWFRCFLADDPKACGMFQGGAPGSCGVCNDTGWAKLQSMGL